MMVIPTGFTKPLDTAIVNDCDEPAESRLGRVNAQMYLAAVM